MTSFARKLKPEDAGDSKAQCKLESLRDSVELHQVGYISASEFELPFAVIKLKTAA